MKIQVLINDIFCLLQLDLKSRLYKNCPSCRDGFRRVVVFRGASVGDEGGADVVLDDVIAAPLLAVRQDEAQSHDQRQHESHLPG